MDEEGRKWRRDGEALGMDGWMDVEEVGKRWWGWSEEKVGLRMSVERNENRVEREIEWLSVVGIVKRE